MMTLSMVAVVGWPGGCKLSLPLKCHIRDSLHWYLRRSKFITLKTLTGSSFAKIKNVYEILLNIRGLLEKYPTVFFYANT